MIWMLCFGSFENKYVYLCCFDPKTDRHKEDEFQIENGIQFWVLGIWMFSWYLTLLSIPISRLSFSGYTIFGETKLNVHLKEYQDTSQKLEENVLRYANQWTSHRRFCGSLFSVVTGNMYVAGLEVRLCDSAFWDAYYVRV